MNYKNLKYISLKKYPKIKSKYNKSAYLLVEIDGKLIENEKKLYHLFKKNINAPNHFYNNLNSFNDLFYDFFDLNNPKNMVVLIKNLSKTKNLKLMYILLDILNDSVDY